MFIKSAPEAEAEGKLREIYESDRKSLGYVPNHARVFSLRPEVLMCSEVLARGGSGIRGGSRECSDASLRWPILNTAG